MLTESARKIAEDAKRLGLWIYEPAYKKWYSPEDFMHIFSYANTSDEFIKSLQLRHPSEGIKAGFQKMLELHNKLESFTKSVIEYYNK